MCGFFGIVGNYDIQKAHRAFATLGHRGPDDKATFEREGLFLGHHRLAVIDLLPEARQPMWIEGRAILFNGEIYNYPSLRKRLHAPFHTRSDTEVALRAFIHDGSDFIRRLRGMYAIAIWDEEKLHLFRDPFGKKPLYYTKTDQAFLFASEIKAITTYLNLHNFRKERLTSYLSFQTFIAPATLYEPIRQLEPGEHLLFDGQRIEKRVDDIVAKHPIERTIAPKKILSLFEASLRHRLVGDVEIGALLSGGIDSSLVATLAQKIHPTPLPTFTVGYEGYEKYDERPYATLLSRHIDSDHTSITMNRHDFLESAYALANNLDEPLGDPAAVPLWFLGGHIRKMGLKVLLTGDGADELFFGYRPYREMAEIERAREWRYKNWLRNYFRAHYSPNREWEWYKRIFESSILYRSGAELFTDLQQNRLLRFNVKDDTSLNRIDHYIKRFQAPYGPAWYAYIDLKIKLGDLFLKKLDRVMMAHGIETRSPFLDRTFARAILSTDPSWRLGQSPKWLLKEVAQKWLPSAILTRRKKGFSYPWAEWLHESGETQKLIEWNAKERLFNPDALRFVIERSRSGRFKHHLYALWHLMLWMCRRG